MVYALLPQAKRAAGLRPARVGYPHRRSVMHAARRGVLYLEGEIVSPGIDIVSYLAGGYDAAVPDQHT